MKSHYEIFAEYTDLICRTLNTYIKTRKISNDLRDSYNNYEGGSAYRYIHSGGTKEQKAFFAEEIIKECDKVLIFDNKDFMLNLSVQSDNDMFVIKLINEIHDIKKIYILPSWASKMKDWCMEPDNIWKIFTFFASPIITFFLGYWLGHHFK